MREVQFHDDDIVGVCTAKCLIEPRDPIRALGGRPELQSMAALSEGAGGGSVQPLCDSAGPRDHVGCVKCGEVRLAVDRDGEQRVALESVACRGIDPLACRREHGPGATGLDGLELSDHADV